MFTQIGALGAGGPFSNYHALFTYGENVHQPDCDIRSDAELLLTRLRSDGHVESVAIYSGSRMTCGQLEVRSPAGTDFFELRIAPQSRPQTEQP